MNNEVRRALFIAPCALFIAVAVSCATFGRLGMADCPAAKTRCLALFPAAMWRTLHEINVDAMGRKTSLLGLTIGDPATRRLRATLMTVEGLTLFDATVGPKGVTIHRALPPLDASAFSAGLLADVQAIFLSPPGTLLSEGCRRDGVAICRFWTRDNGTVEIDDAADGSAVWRVFDETDRLFKEIDFAPPRPDGFSPAIAVKSPGIPGYSLGLKLLEAESGVSVENAFVP